MGWDRIEEREGKAYLRWCRNARGWIRTSSIPWKTLVSVEGEGGEEGEDAPSTKLAKARHAADTNQRASIRMGGDVDQLQTHPELGQ